MILRKRSVERLIYITLMIKNLNQIKSSLRLMRKMSEIIVKNMKTQRLKEEELTLQNIYSRQRKRK